MRAIKGPSAGGGGAGGGAVTTVSTTDGTITTIDTVPVPTDEAILISAKIVAVKDDITLKSGIEIEAIYANNSGTVTLQGAVNYQHRQVPAGWDVTLVISGTDVLIRVVGNAATNIDWKCNRVTLGV